MGKGKGGKETRRHPHPPQKRSAVVFIRLDGSEKKGCEKKKKPIPQRAAQVFGHGKPKLKKGGKGKKTGRNYSSPIFAAGTEEEEKGGELAQRKGEGEKKRKECVLSESTRNS